MQCLAIFNESVVKYYWDNEGKAQLGVIMFNYGTLIRLCDPKMCLFKTDFQLIRRCSAPTVTDCQLFCTFLGWVYLWQHSLSPFNLWRVCSSDPLLYFYRGKSGPECLSIFVSIFRNVSKEAGHLTSCYTKKRVGISFTSGSVGTVVWLEPPRSTLGMIVNQSGGVRCFRRLFLCFVRGRKEPEWV